MFVPTIEIENSKGDRVIVNAYDYSIGACAYTSNISGGDWRMVSENQRGGDEGHKAGKVGTQTAINIKKKREKQPLKAKNK